MGTTCTCTNQLLACEAKVVMPDQGNFAKGDELGVFKKRGGVAESNARGNTGR